MGKIEIMSDEAIVLTRYKDSAGIWTIGVGVTDAAGADIKPSQYKDAISLKQAVDMFEEVLVEYENTVNASIKVPLLQHEFDALVSFHYNTGQIKAGTVDNKINSGDKKGAMETLLKYNKKRNPRTGKLEFSKGLSLRRGREKHLFETGLYGNGFVSVYEASIAGKVLWETGRRVNALKLLGVPDQVEKLKEVAIDAAANDRISKEKITSVAMGGFGSIQSIRETANVIEETKGVVETLLQVGPWAIIVFIAGWWFWRRFGKAKIARAAL